MKDAPVVDFLILADRAEAVNGKMYMMGGGWDRLYLHDFSQPAVFSIAVGIVVPWNCTNEQHVVELRIENADGAVVVPPASMNFVAGRPAIMGAGESQRVMLAVNGAFRLAGAGAFQVVAAIDGVESRRTVFYVAPTQPRAQPGHGPRGWQA